MNFRPKPICFSNKPPFFCLTAVASLPSSHWEKKRERKENRKESAVVIYAHRRGSFSGYRGRWGERGRWICKKNKGESE